MALIEEDGKPKLLWEYVTGNRAPGPVVVGPQDTLRLHCCDGYLHCLDAATGKQIWSPAQVGEPLGYAVPGRRPGGQHLDQFRRRRPGARRSHGPHPEVRPLLPLAAEVRRARA